MQFICQNGGHLEKNGRHLEFMVASVFFQKSTPKEYLCQIWCLYHILTDSFTYRLHYSACVPKMGYLLQEA